MDVLCTKLLNLHIIKMSLCSGLVWETVEEEVREREISQKADAVSASSNGLLARREMARDQGEWFRRRGR